MKNSQICFKAAELCYEGASHSAWSAINIAGEYSFVSADIIETYTFIFDEGSIFASVYDLAFTAHQKEAVILRLLLLSAIYADDENRPFYQKLTDWLSNLFLGVP